MRKCCLATQILLLLWFFLDMTGMYFGEACLVTRSYKEDGYFFLIYACTVLLFFFKDSIGKWAVAVFTAMWFVIQFLCHEWYTIFDSGFMGSLEGKIAYFSDTIQWIRIEGKYIPDLYHTILHLLILAAFSATAIYIKSTNSQNGKT